MTAPIRVLVTCAGSGVAQSVVDSLRHDKSAFFIVTSDQVRHRYAVPDCDGFVALPAISDPAYLDAVKDACRNLAIDVLIPGHDAELEPFAAHRDQFAEIGTHVAVSDPELVALLRNKLDWARRFRESIDVVVPSFSVEEIRAGAGSDLYPMIAKPSGGSASSGLHILESAADADGLPDDLVVQSFLFPPADDPDRKAVDDAVRRGQILQVAEVSVQLVYSREGALLGRFASMNRLKGGVPIEIVPIDDADVWAAIAEVEAVLARFEPRGPINIQGRMTDRGVVFFEMNPRFTGITGNRAQFGFNEVQAVCRNLVRGEEDTLLTNSRKVGVRQVACRAWPRQRFEFSSARTDPKNILLLGGSSWLGRTFIGMCADADVRFTILARSQSTEKTRTMFADDPSVTVVSADAADAANHFGWADAVVNLASARPPDGADAIRQSHGFQARWLTQAAISQVPVIISVSSQSVYGDAAGPWAEASELDVRTPYAFSKFAIEDHLANLMASHPHLVASSLRIARLYGAAEGMRLSEFPHKFAHAALSGDTVTIQSNDAMMDLLDVRDAARALWYFLGQPASDLAPIYNIGSGEPVTILNYARTVDREAKSRGLPGIQIDGDNRADPDSKTGGFMDCALAHEAGWMPQHDVSDAVAAIFDHLAQPAPQES